MFDQFRNCIEFARGEAAGLRASTSSPSDLNLCDIKFFQVQPIGLGAFGWAARGTGGCLKILRFAARCESEFGPEGNGGRVESGPEMLHFVHCGSFAHAWWGRGSSLDTDGIRDRCETFRDFPT